MILHFLEVWVLFLATFAAGCGIGALLYSGIDQGRLAPVQGAFADLIGDFIEGIKMRLGIAPDWRSGFRASSEWSGKKLGGPDMRDDAENLAPAPNDWQELSEDEADIPEDAEQKVDLAVAEIVAEVLPDAKEVLAEDEIEDREDLNEESFEARAFEDDMSSAYDAAHEDEISQDEPMMRPSILTEPRSGVPDNLQRIWGIGKRNEELLQGLGIYHFGQIAAWTPAEARWVASHLKFPERLERDNWIGQAIVLASGGDPRGVSPANNVKDPE